VDCLWAREVPLDVLEAVHFFIRAERGNESATLGLAVKTRYCLKVLISENFISRHFTVAPLLSMSRKLWVWLIGFFEGVHREVAFQRLPFAGSQRYLRRQGARARLVGNTPTTLVSLFTSRKSRSSTFVVRSPAW
jgi:hypothetical protein